MKILISLILLTCVSCTHKSENQCTYNYTVWNTVQKKSIKMEPIQTSMENLDPKFIDSFGCSICQEHQRDIVLKNGVAFKACYIFADKIQKVLNQALNRGYPIKTVTAYRPSKSRGFPDKQGNRTLFSNHSFGSAIDVNPEHNGLYNNCEQWNSTCKLRIGGKWEPGVNPYSITAKSLLVREMESIGLKWGGSIEGSMKDFMHFSKEGY